MRNERVAVCWAAHVEVRRLLSALLCQPERDVFAQEAVVPRLVASLKQLLPGAAGAVAGLLEALNQEDQETLLSEHTRLFVGPDSLPAPPYASVYLEGGRRILGETTEEVRRLYAEEGLAVSESMHEPPDHAALELEFAAFLLEKAWAAWMDGSLGEAERLVAKARNFEAAHIHSWLPDLAASIQAAARTGFYRGVSQALFLYGMIETPVLSESAMAVDMEESEPWRSPSATD